MPFVLAVGNKESKYRILYWSSRVKKFCLEQECPDVTETEWENFRYYTTQYVCTGQFPNNKTKFRKLTGYNNLYEIKPSDQLRVFGGLRGSNFIIVHCIRKKGDTPRQELATAIKRLEKSNQEKLPKI